VSAITTPTSSTTADANAGSPRDGQTLTDPLLEVAHLTLGFAGLTALDEVSIAVRPGELLAVIGPNGAGKSSLFNCISGVYRPQKGTIRLDGASIDALKPHQRTGLGIARTFQELALFEHQSVLDNLMTGRNVRMKHHALADMLRLGPALRQELDARSVVEDVIDFLDLAHVRHQPVGALPYGWRKRVVLGRALCSEPRVLLLDEPVAGMNQEETEDIARYLLDLKEERALTQVLVEHNLGVVLDIADRIVVLNFGRVIADGTPDEVADDPDVQAAYLGSHARH
jgi:branched-chain amino acid transport system ATP-binding protein